MAELTGRHVLAITVGAFGVIIAVNLFLAWSAVATFPGVEVRNSYIASQTFEADRRAQRTLGWTVSPDYSDGRLRLAVTDTSGLPAKVGELSVLVGRATEAREDRTPELAFHNGGFEAPMELAPGKWVLRVKATATDGTAFQQRLDLYVRG